MAAVPAAHPTNSPTVDAMAKRDGMGEPKEFRLHWCGVLQGCGHGAAHLLLLSSHFGERPPELELARADGSYAKRLRGLGQVDVLIVDDWAMSPLAEGERRAFLEICDERSPSLKGVREQARK